MSTVLFLNKSDETDYSTEDQFDEFAVNDIKAASRTDNALPYDEFPVITYFDEFPVDAYKAFDEFAAFDIKTATKH